MARRTKHENIYILISLIFYIGLLVLIWRIKWEWYYELILFVGIAVIYEILLRLIVKRFR